MPGNWDTEGMLSGPPSTPVELPDALVALIGPHDHEVVWRNELGGLTVRVGAPLGVHVKWSPASSDVDLGDERIRLEWARAYTPVPEVLDAGADEDGSWLITRTIDARNAVSKEWSSDPEAASVALGRGLRAMHDAMPTATCPFEWSAARRLTAIRQRGAKAALGFGAAMTPDHDPTASIDDLGETPEVDLVVCHGDACAPNTLLDECGAWVAHVDLGQLGVGDRWADLAVMAWSTEWNYGPGWVPLVYESYGVPVDEEKVRYYRLLWTLE